MKKALIAVVMIALLLLIACESKTTGKRVAIPETTVKTGITGATTVQNTAPPTAETGKTAAEVLKEFQVTGTATTEGQKSGTFYPPVTTDATGKEALAAKTDALMRQSGYVPTVDADKDTGARYHEADGDTTNLPDKYTDSSGD